MNTRAVTLTTRQGASSKPVSTPREAEALIEKSQTERLVEKVMRDMAQPSETQKRGMLDVQLSILEQVAGVPVDQIKTE